MASKRRLRLKLHQRDGFTVLDLGEVEIWDGADLSLLRETLHRLIERERCRKVGVDMSWVKYIPSGFFGMLFDWHEQGVEIRLDTPQPHVRRMLWFRQFFDALPGDIHMLRAEPKEELAPPVGSLWDEDPEYAELEAAAGGTR